MQFLRHHVTLGATTRKEISAASPGAIAQFIIELHLTMGMGYERGCFAGIGVTKFLT